MQQINIHDALPTVFAGRERVPSQVWQCDLTMERGKRYLIVADSGTGKSSLCSYIYGYRRDFSGSIAFDGQDISSLSIGQWCEIRKTSLAYLPQEMRLFPELTAMENIQLKNQLTHYKSEKEIIDLFGTLGIPEKVDTPVSRLSIGQQQRVAIIRTLCQPADFYLLDEPVSHLDTANNAIVGNLFAQEADKQGAAVIVTSVGNHLALDYDVELQL
ncbi:MAG: ATP-binding cassette domain-containing protein [Muribaculaceae bacterium]|nr:ATP-binding cassette domain-containing protein [Muribaculaceae bacterium]